jgi:SnoaL-like protein
MNSPQGSSSLVGAMDELEALRVRLELLEAERGVLRTLHAYGHATDRADEESFAGCFTAGGVCDVTDPAGGPVAQRVEGRDALLTLIRGFARPPASRHRHLLIEPVIDIAEDGKTARAVSYFAVLRERDGKPSVWAFGRYLDDLVLEDDGVWRLRRRVAALDSVDASMAPLAHG